MTGVLEVRYGFSDYKSDYFPTQKEISPVFTREKSYSWRLVFFQRKSGENKVLSLD
jgi:hypothetical protein